MERSFGPELRRGIAGGSVRRNAHAVLKALHRRRPASRESASAWAGVFGLSSWAGDAAAA
eukprot:4228413-Alexandrium_andersonii.AAC.1